MTTQPALSLIDPGSPAPCPPAFNMAAYALSAAAATPGKVALEVLSSARDVPERWTYGALAAAVQGTMTGLADAGLRPGDPLLLRLGNSLDFPVLFFAAIGLGALPVPTSPALTPPEVATAISIVRPRLVATRAGEALAGQPCIEPEEFRPWRALPPTPFLRTRADDPAYIVFTSGTSSTPRAVVHAHRAAWARRMMWADWYGLGPDDRLMHAGAFNWTYTLGTGLTDPWAAGATSLIYTGPPERGIWSALATAHRPTLFAAAPGVYRQLLASGTVTRAAFESLRHGLAAGEGLPRSLAAAWTEATGTPVFEALGMSEISTYISQSPEDPAFRPQRGRKIALLSPDGTVVPRGESGEIGVSARDPGLMLGYIEDGQPRLPLCGEWFRTGDMAVMDANGAITHLGRLGDILNAQGYRVSAREVEETLLAHPGVAEAAVAAVEIRAEVEVIAAFVVPASPGAVTEAALLDHCQARLARYKCPRVVKLMDALPRTATGKVRKRALTEGFPA